MSGTDPRVVLTNPFALPEVRRGSETLVHGLARWLGEHGVRASVLAGGPPRRYVLDGVGYRTVRAPDLRRVHRDLDPTMTFVPGMAARLARDRPDLVHSFLYADAAAARLAKRRYVVSYGGIALPRGFVGHAARWHTFHFASRGAARIVSPSRAAALHLREAFGYEPTVIPNGLHVADYRTDVPAEPGRVLCAAAPGDHRKRVDVLVAAFGVLAARRPGMTLVLAGPASEGTRARLLGLVDERHRTSIEFTGDLDREALAVEYGRAALTCLPSLYEAFGLVLVESLASGTPVVGADHGAIPEIVTDEVGALFAPDDVAACAAALDTVLDRGTGADVAEACRRAASPYDWSVVGPRFLELYGAVS